MDLDGTNQPGTHHTGTHHTGTKLPATELRTLSEQRCWELLDRSTIGRLAISVNHNPDIFPVNFVVDARRIIIRTREGLKFAGALLGQSVAFEADCLDMANHTGWSVVALGRAEEPTTIEEHLHTLDLNIEPWAAGEKGRFIVITPTSITGRVLPPAVSGHVW